MFVRASQHFGCVADHLATIDGFGNDKIEPAVVVSRSGRKMENTTDVLTVASDG